MEGPKKVYCSFFALVTVLALLAGLTDPAAAQQKRPNIVVIMTDDVGWGDLGSDLPVFIPPNLAPQK